MKGIVELSFILSFVLFANVCSANEPQQIGADTFVAGENVSHDSSSTTLNNVQSRESADNHASANGNVSSLLDVARELARACHTTLDNN